LGHRLLAEEGKTKMKIIYLTSIPAFCLLGAILSGCSSHRAVASSAPTASVEKDRITFATNAPQLAYLRTEPATEQKAVSSGLSGRLAWNDDVTARIFPAVSGRITEIIANPGQLVSTGDVLAKIKSPDFGQAQADAHKAVADLNMADRALTRTRELFDHGAAAQKDLEAAEADRDRALSEKERAMATLSLYGGDGTGGINGSFLLKTPVSGVVVEKSVNPGQEVRSDQVGDKPLFVISDPTHLWLFLDVTEADAASLVPNQHVVVHARALPDKTFQGHVEVIAAGLDATTRTVKVRCIVDNSEKLLRAEMYVNANLSGAASGLGISTKAIVSKDNEHYVFIETAPGQFERRSVKLGLESNERSEITDGLSTNENVVVDGSLLLESMLEGENS
jgi:cobalt-zinc-cadmium efflux system membrane fusion protein